MTKEQRVLRYARRRRVQQNNSQQLGFASPLAIVAIVILTPLLILQFRGAQNDLNVAKTQYLNSVATQR
jgi:hypothetical protein